MNIYEADNPVVFSISHGDVISCDISTVANALNGFLQSRERVISGRGRVTLSVEGYDDDPRDLYDTPEVRRYLAALDAAFPYWFYFTDPHFDTLKLLTLCLCRVVKVPGGSTPDTEDLKRFMFDHIAALNQLCDRFSLGNDIKLAATNESLQQLVPRK